MKTSVQRLEFAPGVRRRPTLGRYLLAVAVALIAVELMPMALGMATLRQDRAALASLDRRTVVEPRERLADAKVDPAAVARIRAANQVAKNLTTPWADLLGAIESAPQQSVALLAIEPSAAKKSFRLTAEAKDAKAMLGYVEALRKDRRLDSVVLVSHQLQEKAPGRPTRFQLQAAWGPSP